MKVSIIRSGEKAINMSKWNIVLLKWHAQLSPVHSKNKRDAYPNGTEFSKLDESATSPNEKCVSKALGNMTPRSYLHDPEHLT